MDPDDITLSEISHTEKDKYHTISFYGKLKKKTQINKQADKKQNQTYKYKEQSDG